MGVKGLWTILEPVGESCPLSELAGRSVAVDLSGWVVEAETAKSLANAVTVPYLRNLVYRTSALLLQHTLPVFVLDGAAPQLKLQEMARRQGRAETSGGRQRLRARLQRCARLLDALGVPHLTSDGEAEALCARLDADGLVDGVVSDDVDAALHGARTLYRHLTAGSTGGQVTRYSLRRVHEELSLDNRQLRELALLLGCDFLPAGLPGLGPQTAQQLVRRLAGRPLLQQLGSWLRDPPLSEMPAVGKLGRMPSHCVRCGHPGTETQHRRIECSLCAGRSCVTMPADARLTACSCDWHQQRRDAEEYAAELKARDCARRAPEFEERAAAAEKELTRVAVLSDRALDWKRPDAARFAAEAEEALGWPPDQCWKVVAPLLARWQLRHAAAGTTEPLEPLQVMRASRHHHVDCYLIRWRLGTEEITTHEPRPLVEAAHRPLVDAFLESKKKSKKVPARQPRKTKAAGPAGPEAKVAVRSLSRHITDFFPTRKKATQQPAPSATDAGAGKSGPRPAAAPASGQPQNPDPPVTSRAAPVAGRACHEMSPELPDSAAESPVESTDRPCPPLAGETGDSLASGSSDSDDSYEEPGSDGSVIADLSDIIDAITRTHIADDAVIVISDDDDDTPEVSEGAPSGLRCYHRPPVRDNTGPSVDSGARGIPAGGSRLSADVSDAVFRTGDGRRSPGLAERPAGATDVGVTSDSDSDVEYVPLSRRLALR